MYDVHKLAVAILLCSAMYTTVAVRWLGHSILGEVESVNAILVSCPTERSFQKMSKTMLQLAKSS